MVHELRYMCIYNVHVHCNILYSTGLNSTLYVQHMLYLYISYQLPFFELDFFLPLLIRFLLREMKNWQKKRKKLYIYNVHVYTCANSQRGHAHTHTLKHVSACLLTVRETIMAFLAVSRASSIEVS